MASPPIERKLAAILSADVAGYSRLMGMDESATMTTLSAHRLVIDELIRQHSGRIANTAGDSVLAEFPSVVEAVQCGVEIQQALAARNAQVPEERKMLLRIGINVGDVLVKDQDIFGDGVNLAARLQGLALPGGICISRAVRDQLRDKSPFIFEDQGEQAVKNIARPVRVFAVRFEGQSNVDSLVVGSAVGSDLPESATGGGATTSRTDEAEMAFWESVTDSESASDYGAYLERYPTGNFSALARARLTALATAEESGTNDEVQLEITYWESVAESGDPGDVPKLLGQVSKRPFRGTGCYAFGAADEGERKELIDIEPSFPGRIAVARRDLDLKTGRVAVRSAQVCSDKCV